MNGKFQIQAVILEKWVSFLLEKWVSFLSDLAVPTAIRTTLTPALCFAILLCSSLHAEKVNRYFKTECLTSAGYLGLVNDGTYEVIWREHVGVFIQEQGTWNQKGESIMFHPAKPKKGPYEGREITYKGHTFLAWASEHAPGIVIPIEETKQELDREPKNLPTLVFFKTTAGTYRTETKQPYPFRFLWQKSSSADRQDEK